MLERIKSSVVFMTTIAVFCMVSGVSAAGTFVMKEVKPVDASTLEVTFSNDLLENSKDMSDFSLTAKSDSKTEIPVKEMLLSKPNVLTLKLEQPLNVNTEYDLLAVFVSDKDSNVIENGVDGMLTFVTPAEFPAPVANTEAQGGTEENAELNAAPEATGAETVTGSENPELNAASELTESGAKLAPVSAEQAGGEVKALPSTGTKENVLILLALLLSLGVFFIRKRA